MVSKAVEKGSFNVKQVKEGWGVMEKGVQYPGVQKSVNRILGLTDEGPVGWWEGRGCSPLSSHPSSWVSLLLLPFLGWK